MFTNFNEEDNTYALKNNLLKVQKWLKRGSFTHSPMTKLLRIIACHI